LWTIFSGWLWTMILLFSASWVARITGMSHYACLDIRILENQRLDYTKCRGAGKIGTLPHFWGVWAGADFFG
jgi:hypothetical protein